MSRGRRDNSTTILEAAASGAVPLSSTSAGLAYRERRRSGAAVEPISGPKQLGDSLRTISTALPLLAPSVEPANLFARTASKRWMRCRGNKPDGWRLESRRDCPGPVLATPLDVRSK